jgi:tetratricopeptide (TPR) repeat protein
MSRTALALLLALAPGPLYAQLAGFGGPVAEADMMYLAGEPRRAFEILEAHLATDSTDYAALWRAARAAVVIGIDEEGSRPQNAWLDPAMHLSQRAVALRPEGIDGIYWRGVAAGRRAMNASSGYAVELAEAAYDDAHTILAVDSLHGGAHNMLGKLNYEIMSLSRIKRAIARTFMGNDALDDTSWENAEYHLARAVEVWPDFVLFHFDLGQLHRKRGRRDEAVSAFRQALELPAVHPTDRELHAQARAALEELDALDELEPVEGADALDAATDTTLLRASGGPPTGR